MFSNVYEILKNYFDSLIYKNLLPKSVHISTPTTIYVVYYSTNIQYVPVSGTKMLPTFYNSSGRLMGCGQKVAKHTALLI